MASTTSQKVVTILLQFVLNFLRSVDSNKPWLFLFYVCLYSIKGVLKSMAMSKAKNDTSGKA